MDQIHIRRSMVVCISLLLCLLSTTTCFCMPDWETYGAVGNAVAVDGKGRIVVAGHSILTSSYETATVWRFTENGSLDAKFGTRGFVILGTGEAVSSVETVEALQDSRIQTAGTAAFREGEMARVRSVVFRLLSDGEPDTSFGANGCRVVDDGEQTGFDLGKHMVLDDQRRVVTVSGCASDGTPHLDIGVNDGVISFSDDPTSRQNEIHRGSVTTDQHGRILVAGSRTNGMMAVWRFNRDGTPDLRFGESGSVSYNASARATGLNEANAIVVQADRKIVVAGASEGMDGGLDVAVWRLHEDGSLDTSFNALGYTVKDARNGTALRDAAYGVTLDRKGRIMVTGQSLLGSKGKGAYMILWRFLGDGAVDGSFGRHGLVVAPH